MLLGVFVAGFMITFWLMGGFLRSLSDGLGREPVPEGPLVTQKAVSVREDASILGNGVSGFSLAVWISNPESDWQGLIAGLKRQGLPFRIAHGIEDLDAEVILVYPTFSGKALPEPIYRHIFNKVRSGSVLVTQNVESELGRRFGFKRARYSLVESYICVDGRSSKCKDQGRSWTSLRFEKPNGEITGFETMGYVGAAHPLAKFESGDAALIMNPFGKGALFAFGLDIGSCLSQIQGVGLPIKPIAGAANEDVTAWIYDQIQTIYLDSGSRDPLITKSPMSKSEVLVTHEIRNKSGLHEAVRWAATEAQIGVKALYIVDYGLLKEMTPDLWIAPSVKANLASISHAGHRIGLGWLDGSPPLDALDKGSDWETVVWTDGDGSRSQPKFPGSQTGILRVGRHVLEQGYGLGEGAVEVFVTNQALIPPSFESALQTSGFRFLSRAGFGGSGGPTLLTLLRKPEIDEDRRSLTLLPSRIRVEGLNLPKSVGSRSSLTLLDIPLRGERREEIVRFYERLQESNKITEVSNYQQQVKALSNQKTVFQRNMGAYELMVDAPMALGTSTIHLPVGFRKAHGIPKVCPDRLEVEIFKGPQWIQLCKLNG